MPPKQPPPPADVSTTRLEAFFTMMSQSQRDSMLTVDRDTLAQEVGLSESNQRDVQHCKELFECALGAMDHPRTGGMQVAPNREEEERRRYEKEEEKKRGGKRAPVQEGGRSGSDAAAPVDKENDRVVTISRVFGGGFTTSNAAKTLDANSKEFSNYYVAHKRFEIVDPLWFAAGLRNTELRDGLPVRTSYTAGKYCVRFVDILTYPRPIRKFEMLLDRNMHIKLLREMMCTEVFIEDPRLLRLVFKGKTIPTSDDNKSLHDLGIVDGKCVTVTQHIGLREEMPAADVGEGKEGGGAAAVAAKDAKQQTVADQNKRFVGDLLFGQANNESPPGGIGSIVETFRVNHGYQIIGKTIDYVVRCRVLRAFNAEEVARKNEEELYSMMEDDGEDEKDPKKANNKKKKQKEKEKKQIMTPKTKIEIHYTMDVIESILAERAEKNPASTFAGAKVKGIKRTDSGITVYLENPTPKGK